MEMIERLLFLLCVFGLAYAVFLFFLPKPPVYYTVLYLEPGYYGENRIGAPFARFGIENHESQNYSYAVSFFIDNLKDNNSFDSFLIAQKKYFIEKDQNSLDFASFGLPKQFSGQKNLRFRIETSAFGETYSVHFWLKN